MLVSLTRLRIRSVPAWIQFISQNEGAVRQVVRAPGFIKGALLIDGIRTFWTVTLWQDESSMRRYRGSAPHAALMAKLPAWCDEAWVTHWNQDHNRVPDWKEAHKLMSSSGRRSRVDRPSTNQEQGKVPAPRLTLSRRLSPKPR
jgi:hypothetical protein